MRTKEKLYDYFFHCGLDRDSFISVKPHLLAENYRLWRFASFILSIIFIVVSIICGTLERVMYPDLWVIHTLICAVSSAVYLVIGILLATLATLKRPRLLSVILYLAGVYFLCMAVFSACTNDAFSILMSAASVCLPFLYLDRPYKNFLFGLTSLVVYIVFTVVNRSNLTHVFYNIVGITFLSIFGLTLSAIVNKSRTINIALKLRYEKQRSMDSLTKVHNKTAFDYRVESINKKLKSIDIQFAIVVFDINWLKETNDTYGHKFGDELIIRTTDLIKEVFKTDIYRIGGDEFCCILLGEDYEHVEYLVRNFRLRVESIHNSVSSLKRDTSVACGYSKCIPSDCEFVDVFVRADNEMYKDKEKIKSQRDFGFEVISNQ